MGLFQTCKQFRRYMVPCHGGLVCGRKWLVRELGQLIMKSLKLLEFWRTKIETLADTQVTVLTLVYLIQVEVIMTSFVGG